VWTPGDGPARFQLGLEHGVTPFRVPGTAGGTYLAAGIEHTPEGFPTADTALHQQMNAKRFHKLDAVAQATADWYRVLGDGRAPLGIIAWGSQHGLLREWVHDHPGYSAFLPEILHPFPIAALKEWMAARQWTCVLELSFQGQFHRYLGGMLDLAGVPSLKRSGGVPLGRLELERMLAEVKP
jgi:pyruvate/2-oxoacid:ferredoxin oxidoreductase alpha subunit